MTTLAQWRQTFGRIDDCPWPGPRPMTQHDSELLIGRGDDADRFSTEVQGNRLVILTGESGVGKSSLLNAGLVRELTDNGYLPLLCSDWTWASEGLEDPEAFVAEKVRDQLPPEIDLDRPGMPGLCAQLDDEFHGSAVLILDQFEELIRYQPALFSRMIDWILRVNHHRKTRVVLSLRSEYAHKLKRLNASVRPFTMARYDLEPLTALATVMDVIESGNKKRPGSIDEEATEELLKAWRAAVPDDAAETDLGLLHLQASLYTLHDLAGGATVQRHHVLRMAAEAGANQHLFTAGLGAAVGVKLQRCIAACGSDDLTGGVDAPLVTGTGGIIRGLVGHLSSGGYKLVSEEWDLAQKGLSRELNVLGRPPEAEQLFRALTGIAIGGTVPGDGAEDLLSSSRAAIEATARLTPLPEHTGASYLANLGVDPVPWISDPGDMSSGPMLGMAPRSVLIEELRRFVFAMVWLRESSLIRTSSPTPGQTMVSLIHDGFGPALERWAAQRRARRSEALTLLTAARGELFDWRENPAAAGDPSADHAGRSGRAFDPHLVGLADSTLDGGAGSSTIVNVRWQSGKISASFNRVVFVNCDFRGSRFERCSFRGTVFVNCLLDGVMFDECAVLGGVTPAGEEIADGLPSFVVPVSDETIRMLDRYRENHTDGNDLYSVTSGVPALPWAGATSNVLGWQPQVGGMTMYGGRLNSLMVRDCTFDEDGVLAFRHIAGSSLDIVEQSGGSVDVFGSAIRGLSITRKVGDLRAGNPFRMNVRKSRLVDTWFGDRLNGEALFEDCVLWQLMNLSERDASAAPHTFDVGLENSGYYGIVNVSEPVNSTPLSTMSLTGLLERESMASSIVQMDYRKVPARVELDQRAKKD